jgi:hypothetical protein
MHKAELVYHRETGACPKLGRKRNATFKEKETDCIGGSKRKMPFATYNKVKRRRFINNDGQQQQQQQKRPVEIKEAGKEKEKEGTEKEKEKERTRKQSICTLERLAEQAVAEIEASDEDSLCLDEQQQQQQNNNSKRKQPKAKYSNNNNDNNNQSKASPLWQQNIVDSNKLGDLAQYVRAYQSCLYALCPLTICEKDLESKIRYALAHGNSEHHGEIFCVYALLALGKC